MYWVTFRDLNLRHSWGSDQQKLVCLHDKVNTNHPISKIFDSYIPLVMLSTWIYFGAILLEFFRGK